MINLLTITLLSMKKTLSGEKFYLSPEINVLEISSEQFLCTASTLLDALNGDATGASWQMGEDAAW